MDLRQLRTFVTTAEQGTVSGASAQLHVAQPALSRQIQELEQELGVKLFDRVRGRLVLTTEGKLLLSDCRGALTAISSIKERAQLLRRPDAGVLKLAATPQTIDGVLSDFLSWYRTRRPNVRVALVEAIGAELMDLVDRGDVHLAITTAGALEEADRQFETIWLPPLEFVAASSPAGNIGRLRRMEVGGLGSRPLLLPNRGFAIRRAFDAACHVAGFKPNVVFESRTPHTLLALAEAGHGVAVVPSVLPTHRYNLHLTTLTYRNRPVREGYALVFDGRRSRPPAADEFCRALASHVREVFPISRPSATTVRGKAGQDAALPGSRTLLHARARTSASGKKRAS